MKIERTANVAGSAAPISGALLAQAYIGGPAPWRATFFRSTQPWEPRASNRATASRGCFFQGSSWGAGWYERATRTLVAAMGFAAARADTAQVFEAFVEQDIRGSHIAHAANKDRNLP